MRSIVVTICLLAAVAGLAFAEEKGDSGAIWIRLKDGSRLVGRVAAETDDQIEIVTPAGATVLVPRASVQSMGTQSAVESFPDPNDSRLFFAPTGRPLRKGTGQFSDHFVLFPGVSYGLTDNFTLMGGISIVPGLSPKEQLLYVAPKLGARVSERFAVSAGYLFVRVAEEGLKNGAGIGFAVATLGGSDRSVTAGVGLAHAEGSGTPILMLGGQARLGRRLFFLTENWFILDRGVPLSDQPFSAGLRLCGDRLSVDFGMILVGELLKEGFPMPWLSFSYQFGSARGASRSSAGGRPLASTFPVARRGAR